MLLLLFFFPSQFTAQDPADPLGTLTDVVPDQGIGLAVIIPPVHQGQDFSLQAHSGFALGGTPGALPERRGIHRSRSLFTRIDRITGRQFVGIPHVGSQQVDPPDLCCRAGKQADVEFG